MDYGIIFCRTKQDCDHLERYFNMVGGGRNQNKEFSCVCLHGDRKPQERKDNLEIFKRKEVSKKNFFLNVDSLNNLINHVIYVLHDNVLCIKSKL